MSANLEQSRNQPAWPTPRGDPSRRHLLIGLPAVAVAGGGLRPAPQRQPDGEEAAHLAVKVRTAGWGRPSGFCEALHKAWRRDVLTSLLVSCAAIHGARLGTRPSVLHMLAFSDTIMRAPHWIEPQALWDAWGDERRMGFDPAKFEATRLRARALELEQHRAVVARLAAA